MPLLPPSCPVSTSFTRDGHEIHHAVPVIFKAAELLIEIISYPPHSTDALQGLDKVVFGPPKRAWTAALNKEVRYTLAVQRRDLPRLYQEAQQVALTEDDIEKAFEATGVHPLNRNVVPPARVHQKRT